ncbi:nucleolar protein 6-like [Mercenaria mercenaria]|uniref:nucleolar protein 6-like n=1 Tax=Mercenaria mercenaria TaxID=6596 RepID=UPI00234EFE9D|nr:nucleolar protein 6-like [Mercenaria mercenaria]
MKRKLRDTTEMVSDDDDDDDDASDDDGNSSDSEGSDKGASDSVNEDDEKADLQASVKTGSKQKRAVAENQSKQSGEPVSKAARLSKGDLYKPPTNEELNQLKETENLFHSTLFRMQITELLSEVSLKTKRRKEIENTVSTLKDTVMGLKKGVKYELQDYSWLKDSGIEVPLAVEHSNVKGSFHFIPPVDVRLSGSFVFETCIKPNVTVDLIVVMPKVTNVRLDQD